MLVRQRPRLLQDYSENSPSFLNETVLLLVFKSVNWNPFLLCRCACVCKRLAELAKQLLWKEFCLSRAPKMVNDLLSVARNESLDGGWDSLGKLMFFCAGCHSTRHFQSKRISGHFVWKARFSRTSGRSFLVPQCRMDTLYVTDPCEHSDDEDDDVGLFRGVIKAFSISRTRKMLEDMGAQVEKNEVCSFCRAEVWSLTQAQMIPSSAQRRLACCEDSLEYFICRNGHLHGMCSLVPLSDSEGLSEDEGS
ncbi:hypothetical protein O6H91_13G009200 [Diphasiastrum complanatum]|uniref:Uncharacterized protein n=3 Tax=Diphasiastrum complanatum TaxID=34168 RepID=A0ACC2BS15_DIPCM|nr:hypothetical protein O6H91_13G008900 [Diphasiastrum complanatum]KAJ7532555.1 hypothetical protein O6H91_13G009200 [Diphasiastrum complanatum]KAJ7532556.1 hypothetical protein O6H91_13G009200 [Diphasiastrum complanatum]